jgi:hypothetical protein
MVFGFGKKKKQESEQEIRPQPSVPVNRFARQIKIPEIGEGHRILHGQLSSAR